jgi:hypothetical protein
MRCRPAGHSPYRFLTPRTAADTLLIVVRKRVSSDASVADDKYLLAERASESSIVAHPIFVVRQVMRVEVSDWHGIRLSPFVVQRL